MSNTLSDARKLELDAEIVALEPEVNALIESATEFAAFHNALFSQPHDGILARWGTKKTQEEREYFLTSSLGQRINSRSIALMKKWRI